MNIYIFVKFLLFLFKLLILKLLILKYKIEYNNFKFLLWRALKNRSSIPDEQNIRQLVS